MRTLLDKISQSNANALFKLGLIGIEKEALRVDASGDIAITPHPKKLGSALTHPHITTDYSEALLEFVTPPLSDSSSVLSYLADVHHYVARQLDNEHLWAASMPCRLHGEDSIRIAEYGTSNLGQMKQVYRRGLGYRYGKTMQVIAGIHVNMSLDESFWCIWQDILKNRDARQDFISEQYFVLIRNLQRIGWIISYLFGASPAIDRSFNHAGVSGMDKWDNSTLYQRDATSLRLGDIGYTNHLENEIGVKACYDSLNAYTKCLTKAIETPFEAYTKIGVKVNGEYRQLNDNILQIENEYYSTVRPKQPAYLNEKPTHALLRRGVRYVELRSLDVNPFELYGLGEEQFKFIELLFLYCLLSNSQIIDKQEREQIDTNESIVAHQGREPAIELVYQAKMRSLKDWATEILDEIAELASLRDSETGSDDYSRVVRLQRDKVADASQTPAGIMLDRMHSEGCSYMDLIEELSRSYHLIYCDKPVSAHNQSQLESLATSSLQQQAALETIQEKPFDEFLREYFSQTLSEQQP